MVDLLRRTGDEWTGAVAMRNVSKLHELVNLWLTTNATPAEFLKSQGLGTKTVPSTVKRFEDDKLTAKLSKVFFIIFRKCVVLLCG